ncbi:response regulator receiver [Beggiatoa sp. PS]|nr:response regulator receiver [Beggiatoa sp. PS]
MSDKIIILVIDDEIISRYTIEALLESNDCTLVFAENGKQGIEKAETMTPDLILLDVMMPDMNGFQVCRLLRADLRFKDVPIVMVTGWDDPIARSRCLSIGATDIICKPFNRKDLRAIISKLLKGNAKVAVPCQSEPT